MGSNQYNIKYSSMDQLYVDICTKTQGWNKQLDSWKTSYIGLINMTSFNGQSATAVKSYLGEVHEFLLQSIYVAISRFQSDYLLYKNKYYAIEDNIYATMSRETIKSIEGKLSNEVKYLNNISNEIDRSLSSISDIYWRGKPSKEALEGYLNSEKSSLVDFNTSIENYENNQYSVANGELKSLLEALKSTVVMYSGSTNSVLSYKSGDLCNKTEVLDLYIKVQSSVEHVENNKEEIELAALNQEEVFSQMQKDYEEALEAREDEGRVKMITGALALLVGGAAIILTAGAATPIVVTAAVAGTGSMAYGVSNMVEGGQDVYYASIGDLNSAAINPIRDTIFMGNQGAYDLWGTLNMTVAGLCIPVSQSVNGVVGASKSVIARTAAMRIGKELIIDAGIDFASSNITNFAANQFNLNKTESTLLNLGLSFGLDKSVDSARAKILGESSFAEGMSYDDAKRYNDYWKRVEIGNNTRYPGLSDADIKLWKFADSKLNDNIALNKVNSNEVVQLRMKALELENSLRVVDKVASGAEKSILPKDLTNYEVPSVKNGDFNKWFNDLSVEDFNRAWQDPRLRDIIERRIRRPGGLHEWLLVSRAEKFKQWGTTMDDIKDFRTSISEVEFKNPYGVHGGQGSTIAHNELLKLVDSSSSYEDYLSKLNIWAEHRLKNGVLDLPEGLRR